VNLSTTPDEVGLPTGCLPTVHATSRPIKMPSCGTSPRLRAPQFKCHLLPLDGESEPPLESVLPPIQGLARGCCGNPGFRSAPPRAIQFRPFGAMLLESPDPTIRLEVLIKTVKAGFRPACGNAGASGLRRSDGPPGTSIFRSGRSSTMPYVFGQSWWDGTPSEACGACRRKDHRRSSFTRSKSARGGI
jgi:hypothetical protein